MAQQKNTGKNYMMIIVMNCAGLTQAILMQTGRKKASGNGLKVYSHNDHAQLRHDELKQGGNG
jgi:preprotein translocase subunit SecG